MDFLQAALLHKGYNPRSNAAQQYPSKAGPIWRGRNSGYIIENATER